MARHRKGLLTDLAKAEVAANEHGEELEKAVLKHGLRTLRAPVDGTVQQLAVHTLGGVVTPAQQLIVVVPEGIGIEIEATLPNKDVGFVHKGQEVEIKVETFTFTRCGLLHGRVTSLSQDVVAPQDNARSTRGKTRTPPQDGRDDLGLLSGAQPRPQSPEQGRSLGRSSLLVATASVKQVADLRVPERSHWPPPPPA